MVPKAYKVARVWKALVTGCIDLSYVEIRVHILILVGLNHGFI
jgi:hypothetical protein